MRSHLPCFDEEVNAVSIRGFGSSGYFAQGDAQAASDLALTSTHFCHNSLLPFLVFSHARTAFLATDNSSFLGNQSQENPVDVEVPEDAFDVTINSQPTVAVSTTGSPTSGSANIAVCPPVGDAAGDGFISTGVPAGPSASLEVFLRELAVRQIERFTILPNQIADIQRQLRELTDVFNRTTEWMRSQQAP